MRRYGIVFLIGFLGIGYQAVAAERIDYGLLQLVEKIAHREYIEKIEAKKLTTQTINGMLSSLDPYSRYYTKEEFDSISLSMKGEFGGIGIEITSENSLIKVIAPIDDTPAFHAGIQPGDYITHIDNQAVIDMSLHEAVEKMKGQPGTQVSLTLLREGASEPLQLTLTRQLIKVQAVRGMVVDNIGYIRVATFSEQAAQGVKNIYYQLEKDIGSNLRGLVLDLRSNPGGLLEQSIMVSDDFLEGGVIVSTKGRTQESNQTFLANKGDISKGLPIVVLVNMGTASAAEIVAGALQDHQRGVVIGTKSFGKGSVQKMIDLHEQGAIRLTTARFYTPSGRSIQAEGIVPDMLVEQAKLNVITPPFLLSESMTPKHLLNDTKKVEITKEGNTAQGNLPHETLKNIYQKDYQLARAIELAQLLYVVQHKKS